MPPDSFLHERSDFKALVETVADSEKINDPALVEKDYWIMHAVFGLKQLGLTFELKGGTSLSKGFGIIQRFSEDIDIRIEPFDGLQVDTNPNHERPQHVESRRQFLRKAARQDQDLRNYCGREGYDIRRRDAEKRRSQATLRDPLWLYPRP